MHRRVDIEPQGPHRMAASTEERPAYPLPMLRDLKKLSAEVVKEESEKSPMARRAYASFTKFQALVGPWDHVAEGAYHQFVAV